MSPPPKPCSATDVAAKVFDDFLLALSASGTQPDIVARLRKALLEESQFTERALKAAMFPSDPVL